MILIKCTRRSINIIKKCMIIIFFHESCYFSICRLFDIIFISKVPKVIESCTIFDLLLFFLIIYFHVVSHLMCIFPLKLLFILSQLVKVGNIDDDVLCRHYLLQSLKNSREKKTREMGKEERRRRVKEKEKKILMVVCMSLSS